MYMACVILFLKGASFVLIERKLLDKQMNGIVIEYFGIAMCGLAWTTLRDTRMGKLFNVSAKQVQRIV